jgi:hypothetical protein
MHVPVNRVFNNVARNLGLNNYNNNIESWAEWAFEAEQYIGSNKTFLQKEITYTNGEPVAATAKIEFDSNPTDKTWIQINKTRFIFRVIADTIDNDDTIVEIGTDLDATLTNLVAKLNDSYYYTVKGISTTHTTGDSFITLTFGKAGDAGNHVTLETSGIGKISQYFSGGKERMHNKQIRLPDNMVKLLSIRAGNTIVQPTSSQYKSKVSSLLDRYYINGNRVNFTTDYTEDVVVSYLAVPLSPEGFPMILQGHEEAVAFYIMWKYKSIGYYAGEVPQYIVKDLERRWYQLCGKARGDDNMPNSIELLKIGKMWNAKVPITSFNPPLYDGLNSY